jgi:hypothetical protein
MLVKQCIMSYRGALAEVSDDDLKARYTLFGSLKSWKVSMVVSSVLPMGVHFAVILFLAGFVLYLKGVNYWLFLGITTLLGFFLLLYIIVTLLPAFYPHCFYHTPLSFSQVQNETRRHTQGGPQAMQPSLDLVPQGQLLDHHEALFHFVETFLQSDWPMEKELLLGLAGWEQSQAEWIKLRQGLTSKALQVIADTLDKLFSQTVQSNKLAFSEGLASLAAMASILGPDGFIAPNWELTYIVLGTRQDALRLQASLEPTKDNSGIPVLALVFLLFSQGLPNRSEAPQVLSKGTFDTVKDLVEPVLRQSGSVLVSEHITVTSV